MSYRVIKASEIGDYVYCRRAWWLRKTYDYRPQNIEELTAGTTYHEQHSRQVYWVYLGRRIALVLLFLAVTVLVFWFLSQML